jgi:hypothetical protein
MKTWVAGSSPAKGFKVYTKIGLNEILLHRNAAG